MCVAPGQEKSELFLHLERKGVRLNQALTELSLSCSSVCTEDVSLEGEREREEERYIHISSSSSDVQR